MKSFGIFIAVVVFCFCEPAPMFSQTKPSSDQKAGACSVNVIGNANTVSIKCDGVDRAVAEQIETILNRTLHDAKATRDLSAKLDRLLKEMPTAQAPVAIAPNGIANAAPNLGNQTVNNYAPPARTIPPAIRAECLTLLAATHGKVSVNALLNDSEGFSYAQEWYDLFAASGWEMVDPQVMTMMSVGPPTRGIEIQFHGERPTPGQSVSIPPFLVPLGNCFVKLGIPGVGNPFPDMPEDKILFIVGNSNPN
jgi:hypothetical protein